jgi:hypothetical protein
MKLFLVFFLSIGWVYGIKRAVVIEGRLHCFAGCIVLAINSITLNSVLCACKLVFKA